MNHGSLSWHHHGHQHFLHHHLGHRRRQHDHLNLWYFDEVLHRLRERLRDWYINLLQCLEWGLPYGFPRHHVENRNVPPLRHRLRHGHWAINRNSIMRLNRRNFGCDGYLALRHDWHVYDLFHVLGLCNPTVFCPL